MQTSSYDTVRAVEWTGDALRLLDQRLLPGKTAYLDFSDVQGVAGAIKDMVVRGAPAIGIAAAYGVVISACDRFKAGKPDWTAHVLEDMKILAASRPTAVNLFWALKQMERCLNEVAATADPVNTLLQEAIRIHEEDIAANRRMGELGAALIEPGDAVLTHCNAGALATAGYGTALGVIRSAYAGGRIKQVFADETRPWLQGARLTAWELVQDRIPVTLIPEGAAAHLMKQGKVTWVIVGADRIVANGDAANKIGTYGLAVMAKYHGVKFMVVAPTSTIDMNTPEGSLIPIEQRDPAEVLSFAGNRVAAEGASAWNPVFDVTPADLIDAIVTEKGVVMQPNTEKMRALMGGA
jgi:methylthioribose-1-phosphate isomerase